MSFDERDERVERVLASLERLAGGELEHELPISTAHDALDAIAFGVNVIVGELRYTSDKLRRSRDEAESANEAKTTFLRNVSHEIRTPLSAVLALTDLLASDGLDPARRSDLIARIRLNAEVLLGLVDDLLDLSKIESGKLPFEIAALSPRDVVLDVVRSLEPKAQAKGVPLVFEDAGAAPLHSDVRRVRQILLNVIGNAIKFTARGEVRVRLTARAGGGVVIDVIDSGIGLTAEQQRQLFSPFQQADAAISRTYGGSGLGLVLSKRFCERLGGDLTVAASAPAVGSTFRITLGDQREQAVTPRPAPAATAPVRALAGMRVLIADDHEDIRVALAELLTLASAEVVQACDGHEAVRAALGGAFDVVLMDVRMPGLDGMEAVRLLRQHGYRQPVVALTADAMKEHHNECLAAGYDDYLAKPAEYRSLVDAVLRARR